jgi:hypothetical protein
MAKVIYFNSAVPRQAGKLLLETLYPNAQPADLVREVDSRQLANAVVYGFHARNWTALNLEGNPLDINGCVMAYCTATLGPRPHIDEIRAVIAAIEAPHDKVAPPAILDPGLGPKPEPKPEPEQTTDPVVPEVPKAKRRPRRISSISKSGV